MHDMKCQEGNTPSNNLKAMVVAALCLALCFQTTNSECSVNAPSGICAGPQDRSEATVSSIATTNGNCPINQVSYFIDDDDAQPNCGQCTPGKGGWEDPSGCRTDEYCTDAGKCAPLSKSPFYKKACPYETGFLPSFCGAGLRCYHHVCLPCLDGMVDYSDGKICVGDQWTYSRWAALAYNPADTFSMLIFITLLLAVLAPLVYRFMKDFALPKWKKFRTRLIRPTSKTQLADATPSETISSDSDSGEVKKRKQ